MSYLAKGLAQPTHTPDGLDRAYYEGARSNKLVLQRCGACKKFQWGPEWICHRCHAFDLTWDAVAPEGIIYSYERVWHPVHPALKDQGAYIVALIELPHADDVRLVGNLLGDAKAPVQIGAKVKAVFEHHDDVDKPYTLVQWQRT